MFFLIISMASVLIFFKVKIKHLIAVVLLAIIVSSFFISSSEIKQHQQNLFYKVDARNYYSRLHTIINSANLDKNILTNFESICSEKIPREIKFTYLNENELSKKINVGDNKTSNLLFLKMDRINSETKISNHIENKR